MTEKELFRLRDEIEEAKTSKAELEGQKIVLMQRLEEEWDCHTLEDAETLVKTLEASVKVTEQEITQGLVELDKYEL